MNTVDLKNLKTWLNLLGQEGGLLTLKTWKLENLIEFFREGGEKIEGRLLTLKTWKLDWILWRGNERGDMAKAD